MPDLSDWLEIIVPEDTINTIENPSFELTTLGWTPSGGTLARGFAGAVGVYGGTFTAIAFGGTVTSDTGPSATAGQTWTLSAWVRAYSPLVELHIYNASGGVYVGGVSHSGGGAWERLTVSYTVPSGTANLRAQILDARTSNWNIMAFDGFQFEAKAYATTYCDGDQDGCVWDGIVHASTSRRSANSRAGGRPLSLRQLGVLVTGMQGTGAPPMRHVTSARGWLDGADYQRSAADVRVLTITGIIPAASYASLHAIRSTLLTVLMPDGQSSGDALILRYSGRGQAVRLRCRYDGGLEFGDLLVASERVALRFVAHEDPYWESETERTLALSLYGAAQVHANVVRQKADGAWDVMGTVAGDTGGAGSYIAAFAVGLDGAVYAAGNFGIVGGVAAAFIARWNGVAWSSVTTGGAANNVIRALAVGPDGTLYAGGDFTSIGGVVANRVAKYTPSSGAWATMGNGLGNTVNAVMVRANNVVCAGGAFTTTGAGAAANRVAYFTGADWTQFGVSAMNGPVLALAEGVDGYIYAGGDFTTADGVTANQIARFNTTAGAWGALGAGTNGSVRTLLAAPSGGVYVGGEFVTAGGGTVNRIALWNGMSWVPLGTGLTGAASAAGFSGVFDLALLPNGDLLAVGAFESVDTSGGPWVGHGAGVWAGSTWRSLDAKVTNGMAYYLGAVAALPNGDVVFGGCHIAYLLSGLPQAVAGSARAYPRLHLTGPGTAAALVNHTTGERIQLNQILASGEKVVLDLRPGRKRLMSTWRGDITYTLPSGGSLTTWALYPGINRVGAFSDDAGAAAVLAWRDRFWSLDQVPS